MGINEGEIVINLDLFEFCPKFYTFSNKSSDGI